VSRAVTLVTGAAGFAGSHLLQHLDRSTELVAWSRSDPPPELAALARWRRIDILDRSAVTGAIRDLRPSFIFHCAGLPHVGESWSDTMAPLAVNVMGTHRVLDAVATVGHGCRVLVTGSAHVYGPSSEPIAEDHVLSPASPYALSKLAQEELALRTSGTGIEVIVTRSFNHTGPRQKPSFVAPGVALQIARIERGDVPPVIKVGNLDVRRDIIDVRDTVRAYAALMKSGAPGTVYNVASGVSRPVRALVDALVALARVPIRIEQDPARLRVNDIPFLVGNPQRLRAATGWEPQIPFDKMTADLLTYWRERKT
jgi:GDP-4-dehydro-6-deoxy-D-mannose reductase